MLDHQQAEPLRAVTVFVSHATPDREFVEREIISLLRNNGIATWYSKDDIKTAEQWERSILEGLGACDWFLLVMSPRSARSEWVKDELSWAIDERPGRVIPVLMEMCDSRQFHIRLPRIQHLDFVNERMESQEKLLVCLQSDRIIEDAPTSTEADKSLVLNPTPENGIEALISILDIRATAILEDLKRRKREALDSLKEKKEEFVEYYFDEAVKEHMRRTRNGLTPMDESEFQSRRFEEKAVGELLRRKRRLVENLESVRELFIKLHNDNKQALRNRQYAVSHEIIVQIHCLLWVRNRKMRGIADIPGTMYRLRRTCPADHQSEYPGPVDNNITKALPHEASISWALDSRELPSWEQNNSETIVDALEAELKRIAGK